MLKPLNNQVLIRKDTAPTTVGSLVIPEAHALSFLDSQQKGSATGVVVAVGPKVADVAVDQRVAFGKYAGHAVRVRDVDHLIMPETEISGILE